VLTADAVENFLRQNEVPIQADKGGACPKVFHLGLLELIGPISSRPTSG
jgi:hypothetical protein